MKGNIRVVDSADVVPSAPYVPFALTSFIPLRRTLADTPHVAAPALIHTVMTLSAQRAQLAWHLSSVAISSPYPSYPVACAGVRCGTITYALPPPCDQTASLLAESMQCLARECSDALQFLDLLQWQRWQQATGARRQMERVTARERDILQHYWAGQTRQDIAAVLSITPMTVKTHLRNLYTKLGVHSLQEALAVGRTAGILLPLL